MFLLKCLHGSLEVYKMLENAANAGKMDSVDERNAINYSTYDNLSYKANLTLTSNNLSLERSESIHPTMAQKRLKYTCAKTF